MSSSKSPTHAPRSVTSTSPHTRSRPRRLISVAAAGLLVLTAMSGIAGTAAGSVEPAGDPLDTTGENLASDRPTDASSHNDVYTADNATDGDRSTYWESANHEFPQWLEVDLEASLPISAVVFKLPMAGWEERTQTFEVEGSTDGINYWTLLAMDEYSFDPATDNTVALTFDTVTVRHLRVTFTDNTGWPAAQLAELEIYGPGTGDTEPPSAPGDLVLGEPEPGEIELAWQASTDNVGVVAYDVYANGELLTSVDGSVLGYTDVWPLGETVTYTVRARDAAGNQSGDSNAVTREGHTGDTEPPSAPGDLVLGEPEPGEIELAWQASTDNVGVVAYDVYANGELLTSVDGSVLGYTDVWPLGETVTYTVRARDAAGNQSPPSNAVTRIGDGTGDGSDLAAGKPIEASSTVHVFEAANANDGDLATYWEGASGAYPSTLTVALGADAEVHEVVLRLNPDTVWATRTQTLEILGRTQDSGQFTTLVPSASYTFDPATGNAVTIPVAAARAADIRLQFTANTGAPNGQVADFQVIGTPAPNPDLVVTGMSWSPDSPSETDELTVAATVENIGDRPAAATTVEMRVDDAPAGRAGVGELEAGGSETVAIDVDPLDAGDYQLSAEVDPDGLVIERDDTNNTYTHDQPLVISSIDTSDLVPTAITWNPGTPKAGDEVTFAVTLANHGSIATAPEPHVMTLTVEDAATGNVVQTLEGEHPGGLEPGTVAEPVSLGSWTAADGRFTVTVDVEPDANEHPVKQDNNTRTASLFVGRGADMPFDIYEAQDAVVGGGAQVAGPNRLVGDVAGEASGRQAVTLNTTGAHVEFTAQADTNTLVVRFSIPDAPGGGGITDTLNVYVDGEFVQPITLTSRYSWLYGNEANPGTSPSLGSPRHIYDEANLMFDTTIPAGSTIRLQKDPENTTTYAIDFISLEYVEPVLNPDPDRYVEPNGFTHQDVQSALDHVRMDSSGQLAGVFLPPGDYQTAQKFQVYGGDIEIIGAGPWFTRFYAPQNQENTDVGFQADATANGSTFRGFAYFGNYTSRIDGPGKVFDFQNVANITIDDIWVEHMVCMYWGANTDNMTITNSRMRNLWADGLNMTNGSSDNVVSNVEARGTGDDSFALFAATDLGGGDQTGNVYENLTSMLTWRAAGLAVYGGYGNTFRNVHIADTLVYSGITISSLDFGYPMDGFGAEPPTRFENISIVRAGGHFWGGQTFPGIWIFSASKEFQGIRISNVDIVDPTYAGIMFQTQYVGGQPVNPVTDTIFTDVSITGAQRSGDEFDHKSGIGIWVNDMPETGQGPAVGSAVFENLRMSDNHEDVRNVTDTFTLAFD